MYFSYSKTKFYWKEALFGPGGLILFLIAVLLGLGIVCIHSASPSKVNPYSYQQLKWAAVSLIPFFLLLFVDYLTLVRKAYYFYAFGIFFLVMTAIIGVAPGNSGSRRWIDLGPMNLQTSEVMKLVMILTLARVLTTQQKNGGIKDLVLPLGLTVIPMLLIIKQPDLGSSLVFVPIAFSMIFASGIPLKPLLLLMVILLNVAMLVYFFGLHDYQRKRIETFLKQDNMTAEEKKGDGYHLLNSKIALGNGGLLGLGWRKGTQNTYRMLPEKHTDFIFAIIGEEFGFVGTTLILLFYVLLFCTMLMSAYTTLVIEGQLIIVGVTALLATQTAVNTAMTSGLAPITGITLPFISYGGSSLLFTSLSVAIVFSVTGRRIV